MSTRLSRQRRRTTSREADSCEGMMSELPDDLDYWLTKQQVAELLAVSTRQVDRLRADDTLDFPQASSKTGSPRFRYSEVDAWMTDS